MAARRAHAPHDARAMSPSRRSRGARHRRSGRLLPSDRTPSTYPVDYRERHSDRPHGGAAHPRRVRERRGRPRSPAAERRQSLRRRIPPLRPRAGRRAGAVGHGRHHRRAPNARGDPRRVGRKAASPAHISPSLHISRPIPGRLARSASVSSGFRPRSRAVADNGPRISAWPTRRSTCATSPTGTSAARCGRTWRPRSRTRSIWFAAGPRARSTRIQRTKNDRGDPPGARTRQPSTGRKGRKSTQAVGKLSGRRTAGSQPSSRHDRRPTRVIAPVPRITIQAFCETADIAGAIEAAAGDRRMQKAHVKVQMGGAPRPSRPTGTRRRPTSSSSKPHGRRRQACSSCLDALAEVCDAGTKVVVIGHVNDVVLYRELCGAASATT